MPRGTPGFSGSRLREAREVRGMTGVALSEVLGVSPQAIHNYESGRSTPSPSVTEKMSAALNLPVPFFTTPPRPVNGTRDEERVIFYRSMAAATKAARTRAEHRERWLEDLTDYVSCYVALPDVNIPDAAPMNILSIRGDDIEQVAEDARRHWRMMDGPIGNMVSLLENQGVVVARDAFGADTLDSLSVFSHGRPFVMIGTDKGTAVRWRFDAAHELGHLVLHRHLDRRSFALAKDVRQIEEQANRFAAAFLLPMAAFGEDFFSASLDALRSIKSKWRVSIAMMIMRARYSGLISEEHERRLWINYSRRGWRRNEPLDDTLETEHPGLLRSAVELILEQHNQARSELASTLALSDRDVESLCALKAGTLAASEAAPVAFRGHATEARIYQFPQPALRSASLHTEESGDRP